MAILTLPLLVLSSLLNCHTEAAAFQKRVSVAQVERSVSANAARTNLGAFHLAKSYARYNRPITQELKRGAGQRGTVTSVNKNNDAYWVSPVDIDGQIVNLIFDTGSSDLWVFSTELSTNSSSGHNVFSPLKSPSWKLLPNETWDTEYGDGSYASGLVGLNKVSIGGAVVESQAVEIATNVSASFSNLESDGIVGLGFTNGNTVVPNQQKTFFDNIAGDLENPVLGVSLRHDGPGHFNFGFLDKRWYTGKIWYADIDTIDGWWAFNATGYGIGRHFNSTVTPAIMDTGTSLMVMSDDIVVPYYSQVAGATNGTSGYVFPCESKLPSFTLRIGSGGIFTVPAEYMNFGLASAVNTTVLASRGDGTPPSNSTDNSCYGSLQSSQTSGEDSLNILGDVFLKSTFVVFDMRGPKVGIAHRRD
ncbi:uncharacterized protein BP5553_01692 [Venustampulla echinocandica]|uniref:Peptidase A1 domain-containing protein n=1 Tax=Venustampulla echinocandica TaxID=2656787 RepID=A0A370U1U2_9HELO|nr:uncharacterized protein BP5553_01692 [Venustampulla echinocandica]RDL41713.1 hypothetical protein BP5553_01692 [Venustampulla echinocandica]